MPQKTEKAFVEISFRVQTCHITFGLLAVYFYGGTFLMAFLLIVLPKLLPEETPCKFRQIFPSKDTLNDFQLLKTFKVNNKL